jgi:hypothetical protein
MNRVEFAGGQGTGQGALLIYIFDRGPRQDDEVNASGRSAITNKAPVK